MFSNILEVYVSYFKDYTVMLLELTKETKIYYSNLFHGR